MVHKSLPSLIRLLVLMLAVTNLAHGNHIKNKKERTKRMSDNCSSQLAVQQDNKLPESVRVNIHIVHTEPAHKLLPDVRNRSLSPWNYSINEDPNRFPHVIYEASCRYSACLDPKGRILNYSLNSVPIQQEILVLKRRLMGCQQAYWLEKQMVTVGCTCVSASTNAYSKKSGKSVGN
ncbi:interleukin-17A-like [Elgaria multicarinata webbii]|uniref:interleukin-17A-like n=1 Tax=Elgaria multicarinata webbii TaxID=159646 RepID=UPI002FCCE002